MDMNLKQNNLLISLKKQNNSLISLTNSYINFLLDLSYCHRKENKSEMQKIQKYVHSNASIFCLVLALVASGSFNHCDNGCFYLCLESARDFPGCAVLWMGDCIFPMNHLDLDQPRKNQLYAWLCFLLLHPF